MTMYTRCRLVSGQVHASLSAPQQCQRCAGAPQGSEALLQTSAGTGRRGSAGEVSGASAADVGREPAKRCESATHSSSSSNGVGELQFAVAAAAASGQSSGNGAVIADKLLPWQ